jgi:hypothetical protein
MIRWLSFVCACTWVLNLFPPNVSAQPIISVSGPSSGWVVLFNGQAFAVSWMQTNAATNVGVLVQLSSFGMPAQTGRAYLTSTLGPGTTPANEIASTSFDIPLDTADVVLFSGLTLAPGTYYLSLIGDSGTWGSGWISSCPSSVVAADGASVRANHGFSGAAAYLPASSVWEQPFIATLFSVASVPSDEIFSSASIHTNYIYLPQPGQPPFAVNQTVTATAGVPESLTLDAHDPEGSLMSLSIVRNPAHGTLSVRGLGTLSQFNCYGLAPLIYLPAANFTGADSFDYVVNDGIVSSASATVTINVLPPNRPPVAFSQSVTAQSGLPLAIHLSGADPDGDALEFTVTKGPAHGTLSGTGATRAYTSTRGFAGFDSFKYTVSDGKASVAATVVITVVPNPPSAFPQSIATEFGVPVAIQLSGSSPFGDPLEFTVTSGPGNGTLTGAGASRVYTPSIGFSGLDQFSFVANDGQASSAPAVVSVTVAEENSPPFAPVNLVANTSVKHEIGLLWSDRSSIERGFRIERAVGDGAFKQIETVAANVTTFVDKGVQSGKTYSYRIRAYNKDGGSAYSNITTASPID